MRPRAYLFAIFTLTVGLSAGYSIGKNAQRQIDQRKIYLLSKDVERFRNPDVFAHAEYVARVTGQPLYQVLTGERP